MRRKSGTTVSCDNCGKSYYQQRWRAGLGFAHRFCSQTCRTEWTTREKSKHRTTFQCIECGQTVERFNSQGVHKFCSYKCNWIWSSKNRRGKNSFGYIDGRTPFRKLLKVCPAYDDWRIAVFTRDDWRCQDCGATKKLQAHHLVPLRQLLSAFKQANPTLDFSNQELAHSLALKFAPFWAPSNGLTLCTECHSKEHPNVNLSGKDSRQLSLL